MTEHYLTAIAHIPPDALVLSCRCGVMLQTMFGSAADEQWNQHLLQVEGPYSEDSAETNSYSTPSRGTS